MTFESETDSCSETVATSNCTGKSSICRLQEYIGIDGTHWFDFGCSVRQETKTGGPQCKKVTGMVSFHTIFCF